MSESNENQLQKGGRVEQPNPSYISYAWIKEYLPTDLPHTRMSVGGFHVLESGKDFLSIAELFAKHLIQKWSEVGL